MAPQTNLRILKTLAILEGISYLSFAITVPLKKMYNMPKPNHYVGIAHGILFILYVVFVLLVKKDAKWNLTTTFWALFASIIPFGTFVAEAKIFNKVKY
jgi:integral membrane protein